VVIEASRGGRELSLREVAQEGEVSIATARRRWRDGELPGAYRDVHGQIRAPEQAAKVVRASRERPVGLAQSVVTDALWVLRRVLAFARATSVVPPGFDPTEGLVAPVPDVAASRSRQPTSQLRPLSFPECARIAAHLHPVHQLVLWLQRVMGLRISEASGVLVDDVIDLGDTGLLFVRSQGVATFGCATTLGTSSRLRIKSERRPKRRCEPWSSLRECWIWCES
jgi:hypothetical protein